MSTDKRWILELTAEPIVPGWTTVSDCNTSGAELQRAIIKGFSEEGDPVHGTHAPFTFVKDFTFKEHGEFFRGAFTMAGVRYTGDFYDKLKQYGAIRVTLVKKQKDDLK